MITVRTGNYVSGALQEDLEMASVIISSSSSEGLTATNSYKCRQGAGSWIRISEKGGEQKKKRRGTSSIEAM